MPRSSTIPKSPRESIQPRARSPSVEFQDDRQMFIQQMEVSADGPVVNMETAAPISIQVNQAMVNSSIVQASSTNNPGITRSGRPGPIKNTIKKVKKRKQKVVTSTQSSVSTIHPPIQPIRVVPKNSCSINEDSVDFTVVSLKKKKAKIDTTTNQDIEATPPSSSSPSSTSSSSTSFTTPGAQSSSSTSSSSVNVNTPALTTTSQLRSGIINVSTDHPSAETNPISEQARRFAETRYAFPPFIIKFKQEVSEKAVINVIVEHFQNMYSFVLKLAGHRLKNKKDLLLFVADRQSFSMLYDKDKWPTSISDAIAEKIFPNHLPPQFSIVLRNVPVNITTSSLLENFKKDYPDVSSVYRISNKAQQPTTLVRADINNIDIIDELLKKKFIYLNNSRHTITEYIAPAKVLVCSKCFQIGHFRSACPSTLEVCRICGQRVKDIKQHKDICDNKQCCIRCKGPHEANDVRCPLIKSYRSALTKSLLSSTGPNNMHAHPSAGFQYNDQDFPVLNGSTNSTTNVFPQSMSSRMDTSARIDELWNKMKKLDDNLNRLIDLNNNHGDMFSNMQQMVIKHEQVLQVQQIDVQQMVIKHEQVLQVQQMVMYYRCKW